MQKAKTNMQEGWKSICMMSSGDMSYNKLQGGRRGFKLSPKRLSVKGLRARVTCIFRFITRWRYSYGRALRALKNSMSSSRSNRSNTSSSSSSSSRRWLVKEEDPSNKGSMRADSSRVISFARSNSFYAEAIADCLEFIKRSSSVSADEKHLTKRE